jgi:hypothetical protein
LSQPDQSGKLHPASCQTGNVAGPFSTSSY